MALNFPKGHRFQGSGCVLSEEGIAASRSASPIVWPRPELHDFSPPRSHPAWSCRFILPGRLRKRFGNRSPRTTHTPAGDLEVSLTGLINRRCPEGGCREAAPSEPGVSSRGRDAQRQTCLRRKHGLKPAEESKGIQLQHHKLRKNQTGLRLEVIRSWVSTPSAPQGITDTQEPETQKLKQ